MTGSPEDRLVHVQEVKLTNAISEFLILINPFDDDNIHFRHSNLPLEQFILEVQHLSANRMELLEWIRTTIYQEKKNFFLLKEDEAIPDDELKNIIEKLTLAFKYALQNQELLFSSDVEEKMRIKKLFMEKIAMIAATFSYHISQDAEDYIRSFFLRSIKYNQVTLDILHMHQSLKYRPIDHLIEEALGINRPYWDKDDFDFLSTHLQQFLLFIEEEEKKKFYVERYHFIKEKAVL